MAVGVARSTNPLAPQVPLPNPWEVNPGTSGSVSYRTTPDMGANTGMEGWAPDMYGPGANTRSPALEALQQLSLDAVNRPAPSFSGGSAGGGATIAPPSVQPLKSADVAVPTLAPVDTSAATAAEYGRAKDKVGLETSGALAGLRSTLGGRGMLGSGAESRGTQKVINEGQQGLSEVDAAQAGKAADLAKQEATTNFEGGIAERGQTLGANESANAQALSAATTGYQGAIAQRGQDITAQNANNQIALQRAELASQQRAEALRGLVASLSLTSRAY